MKDENLSNSKAALERFTNAVRIKTFGVHERFIVLMLSSRISDNQKYPIRLGEAGTSGDGEETVRNGGGVEGISGRLTTLSLLHFKSTVFVVFCLKQTSFFSFTKLRNLHTFFTILNAFAKKTLCFLFVTDNNQLQHIVI